jgi:syntaxin-binding protein 5
MPTPLRFEYPSPLPHLTISITNLLKHPSLKHLPVAALYKSNPSRTRITGINLAKTTLECLIHVESGEVFIYKFGVPKERPSDYDDTTIPGTATTDDSYFSAPMSEDPYDGYEGVEQAVESLTSITHLANWKIDGFKPVTVLTTRRGPVIATALSDIGKNGWQAGSEEYTLILRLHRVFRGLILCKQCRNCRSSGPGCTTA